MSLLGHSMVKIKIQSKDKTKNSMNLAIFQKHVGNEANAQITLGKAEKLQRAILKVEDEQVAAAPQITSPSSDEKRDEEEKDRLTAEEKGLLS